MTAGHVTWSFTAFCQLVTPPGVGSCRVALQEEHRSRCALEGLALITQVGALLRPPNKLTSYCGTGHTTLEEDQAGATHWTHTGST